jgi:NADP-dependent aldehyde dehydrogenase
VFGPVALAVICAGAREMIALAGELEGQLTATVHAAEDEHAEAAPLLDALAERAGRVLLGGVPTGVEVGPAMVHGGPHPATSDGRSTSVGTRAILRFVRPVAYQNLPDGLLPPALREGNPLGLTRTVDGAIGRG